MHSTSVFSRKLLGAAVAGAFVLAAGSAMAADAVDFRDWSNVSAGYYDIGIGDTLIKTGASLSKSSYADNPALRQSAWAHAGGTQWYTFHLTEAADVSINLSASVAGTNFNPGLTIWTSGNTPFDGGTGAGGANHTEIAANGTKSPHSFNAVGSIGDPGTLWQSGSNGNQLATLAYAITGPSHLATDSYLATVNKVQTTVTGTGWGENILTGVHAKDYAGYADGVTGQADAGANFLSLSFAGLHSGWYTMYIGGTNNALAAAAYDLSVSAVAAVPEPESYAMFLAGLGIMGALARRRRLS